MKFEVNIDKKYAIIIGLILLTGIIVYAQVDTSQPHHSASQIELEDGITLQERINKIGELEVIKCTAEITQTDYSGDHEGCTVTVSCTNERSKDYSWRTTGEWDDNKCWAQFDSEFTTPNIEALTTNDAGYMDGGRVENTREYYMLKLKK